MNIFFISDHKTTRRLVLLLICTVVQASVFLSNLHAQDVTSRASVQLKALENRDLSKLTNIASLLDAEWNTSEQPRWDIAASLALLSKMVYDDDAEMLDYTLQAMGFTKWAEIKNGSMAAHIITSDNTTVVVMRGTNFFEGDDWRKNVDTTFIRYQLTGECRYHRGFWEAYRSISGDLLPYLDRNSTKSIWLTGHSLGGAMATLCAMEIECTRKSMKPVLVTFGQPRVADSAGAQWIDEKLTGRYARFVYGNDIVPSLPPTMWGFAYAHAGRLIAISNDKIQLATSQKIDAPMAGTEYNGRNRIRYSTRQPVYQATIERPPLTREEFDRYFPPAKPKAANCGQAANYSYATIPYVDYVTDHFIDNYVKFIRSRR